jgi:hypothetical protein
MSYNAHNAHNRSILAKSLVAALESKGFRPINMPKTQEIVFEWKITSQGQQTPVRILIYTSIDKRGGAMRWYGTDAIRICGVRTMADGSEKGIIKRKRVNRVGQTNAIIERTLERARSAYSEARSAYQNPTYCGCGAMEFITKKGKPCCSVLCWKK